MFSPVISWSFQQRLWCPFVKVGHIIIIILIMRHNSESLRLGQLDRQGFRGFFVIPGDCLSGSVITAIIIERAAPHTTQFLLRDAFFVFFKVTYDFETVMDRRRTSLSVGGGVWVWVYVCVCECVCVCVCVCVGVCVCVCVPVCVSLASDSSETIRHHHQAWHGDCLRHGNATCVDCIDLDLHSRSHILITNKTSSIIS